MALKQGDVNIPEGDGTLDHFHDLTGDAPLRLGVYGPPKTRKTGLALTFPEPVWLINFDRDASPLHRHFRHKKVYVHDILVPPDKELDPATAGGILHELLDSYRGALEQSEGTVVIDTVTVLWSLLQIFTLKGILKKREAKLRRNPNKTAEIYPYDWAEANQLYENVLLATKGSPMHSVFIARSGPVYNSQGHKTGDFEKQCQKNTEFFVNLWLKMERKEVEHVERYTNKAGKRKKRTTTEMVYLATVEGSGFGSDQEGRELINPTYKMLQELAAEAPEE